MSDCVVTFRMGVVPAGSQGRAAGGRGNAQWVSSRTCTAGSRGTRQVALPLLLEERVGSTRPGRGGAAPPQRPPDQAGRDLPALHERLLRARRTWPAGTPSGGSTSTWPTCAGWRARPSRRADPRRGAGGVPGLPRRGRAARPGSRRDRDRGAVRARQRGDHRGAMVPRPPGRPGRGCAGPGQPVAAGRPLAGPDGQPRGVAVPSRAPAAAHRWPAAGSGAAWTSAARSWSCARRRTGTRRAEPPALLALR